jgi:hypothetical protein
VTAKGLATRLPEGTFVANQRILLLAGLVALAVSLAGLISGLQDFLAAYLVAYMFALTLCIGSLFFVLIHHVTRSGWSVLVRRIARTSAA